MDTLTGCENVNFVPEPTSVATRPGRRRRDERRDAGLRPREQTRRRRSSTGSTVRAFTACPAECELPQVADGQHAVEFRATYSTAPRRADAVDARTITVDTAASGDAVRTPARADGRPPSTRRAPPTRSPPNRAQTFECSTGGGSFSPLRLPHDVPRQPRRRQPRHPRSGPSTRRATPDGSPASTPGARRRHRGRRRPTLKKLKVKGSEGRRSSSPRMSRSATFECKLDKGRLKAVRIAEEAPRSIDPTGSTSSSSVATDRRRERRGEGGEGEVQGRLEQLEGLG